MLSQNVVRRCADRGTYSGPRYPFNFLEPAIAGITPMVALSERVEWYEIHWHDGRHWLCVLPPLTCVPCLRGIPSTPSGYFVAMHELTKVKGVVRLTPRMLEEEPAFGSHDGIRGLNFDYWRHKNSPKGKKKVRAKGAHFNKENLPNGPNVDEFVRKLFARTMALDGQEVKP